MVGFIVRFLINTYRSLQAKKSSKTLSFYLYPIGSSVRHTGFGATSILYGISGHVEFYIKVGTVFGSSTATCLLRLDA